jgi:hypothetical protein
LPRGEWNPEETYTRTSEVIHFVYFEGFAYEVMRESVTGGSNPLEDVQNSGGNWKSMGSYDVIVTRAIIAQFANLAGGVFFDDKLFSSVGRNPAGQTVQWNGTFDNFTPNVLIDFANGVLNVINGMFSGTINADSGRIGIFSLRNNTLDTNAGAAFDPVYMSLSRERLVIGRYSWAGQITDHDNSIVIGNTTGGSGSGVRNAIEIIDRRGAFLVNQRGIRIDDVGIHRRNSNGTWTQIL